MAHEIFFENGKASMFYVGGEPWHALGTRLETPPPTAEEALRAAGLDWDVVKVPLYGAAGTRLLAVPEANAVVRADKWGNDECPVFGIVGGDYAPLQNREAFQFFDPVIKNGTASYHTAGALGRGERIWVLAEVRGAFEVASGDPVNKYVLLSNSHDGKSSVQLKFTPVRVVCSNTLTLALSNGPTIRIPHRPNLHDRLRRAASQLGLHHYEVRPATGPEAVFQAEQIEQLLSQGFANIERTLRQMAGRKLSAAEWTDYFAAVFPDPEQPNPARAAQMARARSLASHLGKAGTGNDAQPVRGTLWAAYNGVTEFLDHRAPRPGERGPSAAEKHLHSIWFGRAAHLKARAYRRATELVGITAPV